MGAKKASQLWRASENVTYENDPIVGDENSQKLQMAQLILKYVVSSENQPEGFLDEQNRAGAS